jgi:hypothetical protein
MTKSKESFVKIAKAAIVMMDISPPDRAMALPNPMHPAPTMLFVKFNVAPCTDDPCDRFVS